MTTAIKRMPGVGDTVTKAHLIGDERRWRRGMAPVPAGGSLKADGTPDYGIFGPGSMVWHVLLHPGVVIFHHIGQGRAQEMYKPIGAGARDWEPMARKARDGSLTFFHLYERLARGAGMHAPMWLGDTPTAEHTAAWLHKIHTKIQGDVIDPGHPEIGGYSAAGPRDAMFAALTELHPMLRMYEAFAFRDRRLPKRLAPEQRDQFIREAGAYLRLHGAPEEEIPTSMAELSALYDRYQVLFEHSGTSHDSPLDGVNVRKLMFETMGRNFRPSHVRALGPVLVLYLLTRVPANGAMSRKARRLMGMNRVQSALSSAAAKMFLPLAWLMQTGPVERHYLRLFWGSDAVALFENGRTLHQQALADRTRAERAAA